MRAVFKGRHSTGQGGIRRAVGREDSLRADTRLWLQDEEELHRPRLEGKGQRAHCQRKSCQNRLEGQTQGMPTVERLVRPVAYLRPQISSQWSRLGFRIVFISWVWSCTISFPQHSGGRSRGREIYWNSRTARAAKRDPVSNSLCPRHTKKERLSQNKKEFLQMYLTHGAKLKNWLSS